MNELMLRISIIILLPFGIFKYQPMVVIGRALLRSEGGIHFVTRTVTPGINEPCTRKIDADEIFQIFGDIQG